MKTTIRILAVLLALALGLALFASAAMAAEQRAALFTKRLPASTMTRSGRTITLAPVAKLPEGVNAQLKYQWYTKDWNDGGGKWVPVAGATGPALTLCFDVGIADGIYPQVYKPYYLKAYYQAGGTVVYDTTYTTVGFYMTLPDSYEALTIATDRTQVPQFIARPMVYPMVLPTWILFGNAVWPAAPWGTPWAWR